MTYFRSAAAIVLVFTTAACASSGPVGAYGVSKDNPTTDPRMASVQAPLEPSRRVSEQICTNPYVFDGGNLRCM